jgi:hypothetical protein
MSLMSVSGGSGKKVAWNLWAFCSLVVASLSRVGIKDWLGLDVRYFLICHVVFSSACSVNSHHVFSFACLIFLLYSSFIFFYSHLCVGHLVCRYLFRMRLTSALILISSSVHHCLLNGDGHLRGVDSSIALSMDVMVFAVRSSSSSTVSVACLSNGGKYSLISASMSIQFAASH